ncbi:MAG: PEGA domain-containing protein [Phycisphaerales bacterium]|nr:PEGA domain-containing protein [Phycisphaerales bacterium]
MPERLLAFLILCSSMLLLPGCVRRSLEISSSPEGALVWVNGREVGRTPVTVDFMHYGTYDLMIKKRGWEPIIDKRSAPIPIADLPGLDLAVEILPVDAHHVVQWHIEMEPRDESHGGLLNRANTLRGELEGGDAADSGKALDESP